MTELKRADLAGHRAVGGRFRRQPVVTVMAETQVLPPRCRDPPGGMAADLSVPRIPRFPAKTHALEWTRTTAGPAGTREYHHACVITGVHALIYSEHADAARQFFLDVLGWDAVDAGGGWLIFSLPPGELAVHPSDGPERHELYLMCNDLDATIRELEAKGVDVVEPVAERRWGRTTAIGLPGGGRLALYQPSHPSPLDS